MSTSESQKNKRKNAAGQRLDPGWEHGKEIDKVTKKVECRYCGNVYSCGIFRLKHHLARTRQNVEPCSKVPEDVKNKFMDILKINSKESMKKKRDLMDIGDESNEDCQEVNSKKMKGSIDEAFSWKRGKNQTTLNQSWKREEREEVCQQIARFFYTSAIPFNVVNNPEFHLMIEKVGKYGVGLKPPSYHEIRVTYLRKEVLRTLDMLEEYKEEWKKTGCTIMSDGWTDTKRRSICNFMVNSPKGTLFLSSIDTSDISKTAEKVFEMLDAIVEKVGAENVVQVVTDNASNYKAAGEKLMNKRKHLYWTPCAAHCIDLMLEDFDKKLEVHSDTIGKAKSVACFIYTKTLLLNWMRKFTKDRELIRPVVTRFATSYLTLRSFIELRGSLLAMFSSEQWCQSRFAKTKMGKKVELIVMDTKGFWQGISTCLKAALPLVKVLHMVDSDMNLAMGFIYDAMEKAKEQIKENFKNVKKYYVPILEIVNSRWETQLHRPLHAVAYFLNPRFQYSANVRVTSEIKIGLYDCLNKMISDPNERVEIDLQMDDFKNAKGLFGLSTAIATRERNLQLIGGPRMEMKFLNYKSLLLGY